MTIKLQIPEYLSIELYKQITQYEHLPQLDKMTRIIAVVSDTPMEEITQWKPQDIQQVYVEILKLFGETKQEFYPIFEYNGVTYGYSSLSKMTLGEYIDLENLTKKPIENLEQIMAVLYRPIKKHRFKGITWAIKQGLKLGKYETENVFEYYTLEKYDNEEREAQAEILKNIPISFALGALSFFLQLANHSLLSSQISSLPQNQKKEMKKKIKQIASTNIGDGLRLFITYQKVPFLTSMEIKPLRI